MKIVFRKAKKEITTFIIFLISFLYINSYSQPKVELLFQSRLPFINATNDLVIFNSKLYIKSGNDLLIGDILDDSSVLIHPDYLRINNLIDLCNQDSILIATTNQELIIFEITESILPDEKGRIERNKLSSIFKCDKNIYVVYNENRFFRLNLENLQSPTFIENSISFENTDITWIESFENLLYVATFDSGIFCIDVSDFSDPKIIARIYSELVFKKIIRKDDILIALFEDIQTDWEFGKEKYDSGIIIYSISESGILDKISEHRISPGSGDDIVVTDRYLYLLSGYYDLGDLVYTSNRVFSFDIINPRSPILLDSLSIEVFTYNNFYWPQMMVWDRDHLWIAQWDGIVQVNTANPNSLIHCREIDYGGIARNIDVDSKFIAVTDDNFGLHILDRSVPERPVPIASFSEMTYWGDVKINDGLVYATSSAGGFRIYDLHENPHEISHLPLPGSGSKIFLKDTLAFIGDGSAGLTIINIRDRMNPRIIGRLELENRIIYNIQVQDNLAYVTYDRFGTPGFGIIDISNVREPIPIYTSPVFTNYVKGLVVDHHRLFVQGDYSEIKVYDITDPVNPQYLTQIETGTSGNWHIFIEDTLMYSTRGGIYDISDLINPVKLCDMPKMTMGFVKSDDYLYITGAFSGIYTYFIDISSSIKIQNEFALKTFNMYQNYPNPFNNSTNINYYIPADMSGSTAEMTVYNSLGQEVRSYVFENQSPGMHQVSWDGRDQRGSIVHTGVYLFRIKYGGTSRSMKAVFLK